MSFFSILTYKTKHREIGDVYTFSFSVKKKLHHKAGQHGIFMVPGFYRPYPFSLSSSPEEHLITFSTHTGSGSMFKKKLMGLKPGAKMFMIGPLLTFTFLKGQSKYVFLAQGIGITPFRSMLVHAHEQQLDVKTTLIHVDSKDHVFKEVTKKCATQAFYPTNPEAFQKQVKGLAVDQVFYLSGSPRFVSSTRKLLTEIGVSPENIKKDSFLGY